jgi:phage protein D
VDAATIVIDDHDCRVKVPKLEVPIEIDIGWKNSKKLKTTYIIDEVVAGSNGLITIESKSLDIRGKIKQQVELQAYVGDLRTLFETVAKRIGLELVFDEKHNRKIEKAILQQKQSDMAFITQVCFEYQLIPRFQGNKLFIKNKAPEDADFNSSLGLDYVLKRENIISWEFRTNKRDEYKSVSVDYYDFKSGGKATYFAGFGDPVYKITKTFVSKQAAEEAANAMLKNVKYGLKQIRVALLGNPMLRADTIVELQGFKEAIDGRWNIISANHTFDSGGYRTEIEGERF